MQRSWICKKPALGRAVLIRKVRSGKGEEGRTLWDLMLREHFW